MKNLCLLIFIVFSISASSQEEVLLVAEEMPIYKGCEVLEGSRDEKTQCTQGKIMDYLITKARYPEEAKGNNLNGIWFISFVVNEKAIVEQVKVIQDPTMGNQEMTEEAIRLVKSLEFVEPGKQRGKPVKIQMNVPVKFRTDEEFSNLLKKGSGPKFLEDKREVVALGCEAFVDEEEQLKSCSLEYIERFVKDNAEIPGIVQEMDLRLASVVIFIIGQDGSVEEAEIKKSALDFVNTSSDEEVEAAEAADQAALEVVKKLKFTMPEQNNGEPRKQTCQVPVVFTSN